MVTQDPDKVFAYRMERFLRMDFTPSQAERLAESEADWHEVETWLQAARELGYPKPHGVVLRIAV